MKTRVLKFLMMLSVLSGGFSARAEDWSEIYKKAVPSVPLLYVSGGICSAALITSDLILTADHCVNRLRPVRVSWSDAREAFEPAHVVAFDREHDIALVRLENPSKRPTLSVAGVKEEPIAGQPVATIGHPSFLEYKNWGYNFAEEHTYLMSAGIVSKTTDSDLVTDMSLTPGNSGGPILDHAGRVVGVVSRKRAEPMAGAIGNGARAATVRNLITQNTNLGDRRPAFYEAKSHLSGSVVVSSFGPKVGGERIYNPILGLRLDFSLADRLNFGYLFNLDKRNFTEFSVGWKFQFEESGRYVWGLTPLVTAVSVKAENSLNGAKIDESVTGYGVEFSTSRYYLNLRLLQVPLKDENLTMLQVALPIF